jgi:hypothetical protein
MGGWRDTLDALDALVADLLLFRRQRSTGAFLDALSKLLREETDFVASNQVNRRRASMSVATLSCGDFGVGGQSFLRIA